MVKRASRRRLIALGGGACVGTFLAGCGSETTRPGLYVVEPDGAPRWIDDTVGPPAWAPDGASLAWGDERGLRIWTRSTGDISLVTAIPMAGRPAWSPDGSAIAFLDPQSRAVQRADVASGISTALAPISERPDGAIRTPMVTRGGPAWSPDGALIAFVCWDGFGDELCVVDADGQSREQLTSLGLAEEKSGIAARSSVTSVAWSSDSTVLAVAVQAEQQGATSGIFRVELDSRSGRRISTLTANAPIAWEAGEDAVIFSARVEGRSDVYSLSAEGGNPEPLTSELPDGAREPAVGGTGSIAAVSGARVAVLQASSPEVTYREVPGLASAAPALSNDGQLAFLALSRPIEKYP